MTKLVKYPRTYHLPWSNSITSDDKVHTSTNQWKDMDIVITIKMDGENTTMYSDYIHARSLDSCSHPSQDMVKSIWGKIRYNIPKDWRICGENLYAQHSIFYNNLPSYFLGFNIWNDDNICLSWDETIEWFNLLSIHHVPILYEGKYDEDLIKLLSKKLKVKNNEGYIIRPRKQFHYNEFNKLVGKYVRKNHVTTSKHWKHSQIIPNKLRNY